MQVLSVTILSEVVTETSERTFLTIVEGLSVSPRKVAKPSSELKLKEFKI